MVDDERTFLLPAERALADLHTGCPGLDEILGGGLPAGRVYLLEGEPGTGKTTLALQFLREGDRLGETCLYVGLSETRVELLDVINSHGWGEPKFEVLEVHPSDDALEPESQYTIFQPSEIELGATTHRILDRINTLRPRRVVIDSLSEMRLLAQSAFRFRRQILALRKHLVEHGATTILIDDRSSANHEGLVHTLVTGVISLEHRAPDYGDERRQLRVAKLRARRYLSGYHDFRIDRGGLVVFPRRQPMGVTPGSQRGVLRSGIPAIDELLGGGIHSGTSTLLSGPSGAGKSSVATQFAMAAIARGDRAAMFIFDETVETFLARGEGLSMPVREGLASGGLTVEQVDPARLSPGEFAARVTDEVERGAKLVVVDSLNGYLNAMAQEKQLVAQLHDLLMYLSEHDVTTLLVLAHAGVVGEQMHSPIDVSYLADAVILFRYFEAFGEVRKALSVLKRRTGMHESAIRELSLSNEGLHVGPPLRSFQGVLKGVPNLVSVEAGATNG